MLSKNELYTGLKLTTGGSEDPLLPKLLHAINNADEIEISVSFLQFSGMYLLLPALEDALARTSRINILTSDYLCITDPRALKQLMLLQERGANTKIFQCRHGESFHMKTYIFIKNKNGSLHDGCAFIGSNNISATALQYAHEWCIRYDFNPDEANIDNEFSHIRSQFNAIFTHQQSHDLTHNWINDYQSRHAKLRKAPLALVSNDDRIEQFEPATPNEVQQLALTALCDSRNAGFKRGLVVLATGMGKTWLAAFDAQQFQAKRILFVAHREEILLQAQNTFVTLMNETSTGLYNGKETNKEAKFIFASVQTLGRKAHLMHFKPEHFDYIIIDEFHHASAPTYKHLLAHFQPQFLLGLTATPERTDQADILSLVDNNLVFERNLVHGIEAGIIVPFDYHGIFDDSVDYQTIPWRNGKFDPHSLDNAFATLQRANHVFDHWQRLKQTRTLAFCMSIRHANFMVKHFTAKGVKAAAVYNDSQVKRNEALLSLKNGELDIIFSVDLFNEGTDLPSIDTILMIRPSESKILFLQQLGRGLRTSATTNKNKLTVVDYIGNHHSFLNKPFALLGEEGAGRVLSGKEAPTLPDGCYVNLPIELINLWQTLKDKLKYSAVEEFNTLYEQLGHRPTATEFFQHGYDLTKVRKQHKSWFNLVKNNLLDSASDVPMMPIIEKYHDFMLESIEMTSMTKCFKPILLAAFLELNGFNNSPTTQALSKRSWLVLNRRPDLFNSELPEKQRGLTAESEAWHKYWLGNPIKAFTNTIKSNSQQWFSVIDGFFVANIKPTAQELELLHELVQELVDYRLAKYINSKQLNLQSSAIPIEQSVTKPIDSLSTGDSVSLPYYPDLRIACGNFKTGTYTHVEQLSLPAYYDKYDPKRYFVAPACGNSMHGGKNPIANGDLLLLEWITPVNAGSISSLTLAIERIDDAGDSEYLLRVVKKQPDGRYLLKANNPEYEDKVATDNMKTFARLIKVIKK
ncbi:DEAD/DEAH box helicase family protein [Shewanella schlegeliana]|uniref:DEAD/DEAH box helicase family protein n=2 Tax=Shewanella schlegeliana TaxID=190308 RepID=A0ABS1SUK5_9GAMM|nr:DEAD/DEAH box helicase family protein [Shewanella schlegeliana]MBL4912069.1 DEAD/DEAH box helicase family protein [Shewanella schlegeliana]